VLAVSTELAKAALEAAPDGIAVWCWTVYDVETAARLRQLGVHGLITDVPQALVTAMRAPQDLVVPMPE
jgi:glycerophosphoryl diester phosphodiesterase